MRQSFGSYSQYSGDEILGQANFDNPYGVMEYAHEEINQLPTDNLSVAMQTALATTFAKSYGARSAALMDVMPFTPERQIQNEFLKSPVDISAIASAKVGNQTFGEMYPSLNGIQTFGDVANVLYASNAQGILSAAKQAASRRKDFGPSIGTADDIIGQGTIQFYDAMFSYQSGKSEFPKYAQSSVFNGLTAYYRDQAGIARMQGGSLEALVDASPSTYSDEGALSEMPSMDASSENDFRTLSKRSFRQGLQNKMLGFGNTPGGTEYPVMYQQIGNQNWGSQPEYRGGSSANARLVFPTGLVTNDPGEPYYNDGQLIGYSPFDKDGQVALVKPHRAKGADGQLHKRRGYPVAVTAMDLQRLEQYHTAPAPASGSPAMKNIALLDKAFSKINWNLTNTSGSNEWVSGMGASQIEIADAEWNAAGRTYPDTPQSVKNIARRTLSVPRPEISTPLSAREAMSLEWSRVFNGEEGENEKNWTNAFSEDEIRNVAPIASMTSPFKPKGMYNASKVPSLPARLRVATGDIPDVNYQERFKPNDEEEFVRYGQSPHSADPAIVARWKADAVRGNNKRELLESEGSENRMTTDSVHASALNDENDARYMEAVGRLNAPTNPADADWGNAASQIQVRGSARGFSRKENVTAYLSASEQARSKRDYNALKAAGLVGEKPLALPSGMEEDMEFNPIEADPFGSTDISEVASVTPRARRTGSDIGNTMPGTHAYGTPAAQRSRRDKVFGSIDYGSTPMPASRIVRASGGGGRTPPPPPPPIDPNDAFGSADDNEWGQNDFDPFQNGGSNGAPTHDNNGTPTPKRNLTVEDGLDFGSRRSAGYNPSVNPMRVARRKFLNSIGSDAGKWQSEFGGTREEIALRQDQMFQDYLSADASGVADNYVDTQVPARLRGSFRSAAWQGSRTFQGAVNFAKKMSPVGATEYFAGLESNPRGVNDGYDSDIHGHAAQRDIVNPNTGEMIGRESVVMKHGEVVQSGEMVTKAFDIARTSSTAVTGQELPAEPGSAMATAKARISQLINQQVEDFSKGMKERGIEPDAIQKATTYLKDAATGYVDRYARSMSDDVSGAGAAGDVSSRDEYKLRSNSKKFSSVEDARATMETRPRLKAAVEEYLGRNQGESLESMVKGDMPTDFQDDDMAFQFGGPGKGRDGTYENQNQRGGGLWRGAIGSAMYGAYIGSRMWKMGMGATMQAAATYGQHASDIGNIAGPGMGTLGGESGYAARQTLGQIYEGRGAYQEFGAFTDLPFYMAASGNEGASRMFASAKAGATTAAELAIGGGILGQMAATMPSMAGLAGVANALPVAGAVIGAGMALGTGAMELYNNAHPDEDKLSWSSITKGTINQGWYGQAAEKYLAANPSERTESWFGNAARNVLGALPGSSRMGMDVLFPNAGKSDLTKDQLRPYLTDAQYGTMFPEKNDQVEEAIKNSEAFIGYVGDANVAKQATQLLFAATGKVPTKDIIDKFGTSVQTFGTSAITDAAQYAGGMGFTPGSDGYLSAMESFSADTSVANRYQMSNQASRYAQMGSQVAGYMSSFDQAAANGIAAKYDINTQSKARNWQSFNQVASTFQKGALSVAQEDRLAQLSVGLNNYQAGAVAEFGTLAGQVGANPISAMDLMSQANLSPQVMSAVNAAMSGDLRGMSYAANHGTGDTKFSLFDNNGNSVSEVSGRWAMGTAAKWGSTGLGWITGGSKGQGSATDMASRFLGGGASAETVQAFMDNGTRGIQALATETSYQASMASAGIQMRQLNLQGEYMTASWGIQDRQRQMGYDFQTADFNARENQMNMANSYSIQRENNQYQRMNTSQSYNLWQMDFSRSQQMQQRDWSQEDWQYQDTQRGMNFEYQMTDMNENIRFSSGRQRRDLVRQRDRAALSYNMEGEQIDTQRNRQKELWAGEDERFKKQKTYTLELNDLDKQSFELNKSQRVETYRVEQQELARARKERDMTYALETEQIALERDHQTKSLELQKEAAGVQAWAAQKQHEYQVALEKAQQNWSDLMGNISNDMAYDPAIRFTAALDTIVANMQAVGLDKPVAIGGMITSINQLDLSKIGGIISLIRELNAAVGY